MIRKGGRKPRRVTFIKAKLRRGEGWQDVQIGNISSSGLMLRLANPPNVGCTVEVRRRGWQAVGEVVWRERSRIGVRAFDPIDASELTSDSGIGQQESDRLYAAPARTIWHWLRRR